MLTIKKETVMAELHETRMGQRLIEGTMPRIAQALERIAAELKRANDLQDKKQDGESERETDDV